MNFDILFDGEVAGVGATTTTTTTTTTKRNGIREIKRKSRGGSIRFEFFHHVKPSKTR